MTRIHLIRHAAFSGIGQRLVGRADGVTLNDLGREQAARLASAFAGEELAAVYTSPLERAHETAGAIAALHELTPQPLAAFTEVDFGDWSGRDMTRLDSQPAWHDYNTLRAMTRPPGGELLLETQARAVAALLELERRHDSDGIVIVSHADVIRAVLVHILGMPQDHLLRLELLPASWSTIEMHGSWARVLCIGATAP